MYVSFIDQYVAEALDALVVVADRAVAGNDRPVVLGREMPYEHCRGRIAVRNGISPVGDEIDHLVRLGVLGRSTRSRRGLNTRNGNGQRPVPREDHTSGDTCDQQCAHYFRNPFGIGRSLFYPVLIFELSVPKFGIDINVHALDLLVEPPLNTFSRLAFSASCSTRI